MLARILPISLLASVLLAASASSAQAGPAVCHKYDDFGYCSIWIEDPGDPGDGGGGGGGGGGGAGDGGFLILTVNGQRCIYQGPTSPQPPKSEPVWEGHTDGAIFDCWVKVPGEFAGSYSLPFWAKTPPAAPPDPRDLADRAVKSMNLRAVGIGIVPENRPGRVGIIGMPTWMWVDDPSSRTVGPITRSASAGGVTVTATAALDRIVWRMGDGTSVTCAGRGTPYADGYGRRGSPTCGHTYTRAGTYTVTATSYWTVDWTGLGQTGTIPLDFARSATITMGEAQVLAQ